MTSQQVMHHCKACDRSTVHVQQTTNHILHLLLAIVTAGLWLIVWLALSSIPKYPKCGVCGRAWYLIDLRGSPAPRAAPIKRDAAPAKGVSGYPGARTTLADVLKKRGIS